MDLRPGAIIAERYRVDRKVGAGGMGEVWSGEHLSIGIKVALKRLLPAAALNPEVVTRFRREAVLLGRIRSDYVARVVDFVTDEAFGLVLVMEYVEGLSLAKRLSERVLDIDEAVELGCDLACALADLHRSHVVHRDLKPGNVILSPLPGGRTRAVIVDFGVSRMTSAGDGNEDTMTGITSANMAVGTMDYMAPEQVLNSREATGASDIYAAGAILFRAVTGRNVFSRAGGENEVALQKLHDEAPPIEVQENDRVAVTLRAAVAQALRKKPRDRFKSADDMLGAFLPLRDLARATSMDLESTTHDISLHFPGLEFASTVKAEEGPSVVHAAPADASVVFTLARPSNSSAQRAAAESPPTPMPTPMPTPPPSSARATPAPVQTDALPRERSRGVSLGGAVGVALVTLLVGAGLGTAGGPWVRGRLGNSPAAASESAPAPAAPSEAAPRADPSTSAAAKAPEPEPEPVAEPEPEPSAEPSATPSAVTAAKAPPGAPARPYIPAARPAAPPPPSPPPASAAPAPPPAAPAPEPAPPPDLPK